MSLLRVAPPLTSLVLFSAFAVADLVYAPGCTVATWDWTFNSIGQNACLVVAFLMATCDDGVYTVDALTPGYSYLGPSASSGNNFCYCSTVGYSLFSACDACQGATWITWSEWVTNCVSTLPPSSFPNPIPAGTLVPHWALLDVTNENTWNANSSYAVGDTPEAAPGSILGPSGVSASRTPSSSASPTGSSASRSSGSSNSTKSNSNAAAIAGGVAGAIVAVSIAVVVLFLYRRRRPLAPPAASAGVGASQPQMDETPVPLSGKGTDEPSSSSWTPMRLYDPDDPTTFPGYQSDPRSMDIPSQLTMSSNTGTGNAPNTQTSGSLSVARGYHGLPTV